MLGGLINIFSNKGDILLQIHKNNLNHLYLDNIHR